MSGFLPPPSLKRIEQRLADEDDYGSSYSNRLPPFDRRSTGSSVQPTQSPFQPTPRPLPSKSTATARILASKPSSEPISRIILPERLSEQLLRLLSRLPSMRKPNDEDDDQSVREGRAGRYHLSRIQEVFLNRPRFIPRFLAFTSRTEGTDRILRLVLYVCKLFGGLRMMRIGRAAEARPGSVRFALGLMRLADCLSDARTILRFWGLLSTYEALTSGPLSGKGTLSSRRSMLGSEIASNTSYENKYRARELSRVDPTTRKKMEESGSESETDGDVDDSETSGDEAFFSESGTPLRESSSRCQGVGKSSDSGNEAFGKYSKPKLAQRHGPVPNVTDAARHEPKASGGTETEYTSSDYESSPETRRPATTEKKHRFGKSVRSGNKKREETIRAGKSHVSALSMHTEHLALQYEQTEGPKHHRRRSPTPPPPLPPGLRDMMQSSDSFLRILRAWQNISLLFYYPLDQLSFLHKHGILTSSTNASVEPPDKIKFQKRNLPKSSKAIEYCRWSNAAWLSYLILDAIAVTRSLASVAESMAVVRRQSRLARHKTRWTIESLMGEAIDFSFSGGFSRVASAATSAIGGGISSLSALHPFSFSGRGGHDSPVSTLHRHEPTSASTPIYNAPISLPPVENTEEHRMLMEELNGLYAELRILGLRTISLIGDVPLAVNGILPSHPLPVWAVGLCGTFSSAATLALRWEYMMGQPPTWER
ncbi:hypothetical protein HDU67_006350 [Dinochytrium kinnereticum]|nr:hypothetical protein HDU67_006350 [Dinochytrium kinnereticum]